MTSRDTRDAPRTPRASGPKALAAPLDRWPFAALLVAALLLGGSAQPLGDMAVQLIAIAVMTIMLLRLAPTERRDAMPLAVVVAAVLLVAALQLVPIPMAWWQALPGRAEPAALLATLGYRDAARPLSLAPTASASALLATLPGLAAMLAGLVARPRMLRLWLGIVILGAIASAVLGAAQIIGNRELYLYDGSNIGFLTGLFANRNHASDLSLVGLTLLGGSLVAGDQGAKGLSPQRRVLTLGGCALLAVATILTGSRFAFVLLTLLLAGGAVLLVWRFQPRYRYPATGAAIAACVLGLVLLSTNARVARVLDRFDRLALDLRPEIWRNSWRAAIHYWPAGSGLGTFGPVYAAFEQVDRMPGLIVNHAHNEYLELVLELGLAGVVLLAGYTVALAWATARTVRRSRQEAGAGADGVPAMAALIAILVLLAHSTNEFPLRNLSLLTIFGLLNGIVFRSGAPRSRHERSVQRSGSAGRGSDFGTVSKLS